LDRERGGIDMCTCRRGERPIKDCQRWVSLRKRRNLIGQRERERDRHVHMYMRRGARGDLLPHPYPTHLLPLSHTVQSHSFFSLDWPAFDWTPTSLHRFPRSVAWPPLATPSRPRCTGPAVQPVRRDRAAATTPTPRGTARHRPRSNVRHARGAVLTASTLPTPRG
jgi:hypothetical protein